MTSHEEDKSVRVQAVADSDFQTIILDEHGVPFFKIFFFFFERQITEKRTERKISYLLVHSLKGHNYQS